MPATVEGLQAAARNRWRPARPAAPNLAQPTRSRPCWPPSQGSRAADPPAGRTLPAVPLPQDAELAGRDRADHLRRPVAGACAVGGPVRRPFVLREDLAAVARVVDDVRAVLLERLGHDPRRAVGQAVDVEGGVELDPGPFRHAAFGAIRLRGRVAELARDPVVGEGERVVDMTLLDLPRPDQPAVVHHPGAT